MKKIRKVTMILCFIVLLGFPISAYAATKTRTFTYNFKHQLGVNGTQKLVQNIHMSFGNLQLWVMLWVLEVFHISII